MQWVTLQLSKTHYPQKPTTIRADLLTEVINTVNSFQLQRKRTLLRSHWDLASKNEFTFICFTITMFLRVSAFCPHQISITTQQKKNMRIKIVVHVTKHCVVLKEGHGGGSALSHLLIPDDCAVPLDCLMLSSFLPLPGTVGDAYPASCSRF